MKKYFLLLLMPFILMACNSNTTRSETEATDTSTMETPAVPDMHNAQNSLDVPGVYTGTLPCADCPGIKATLTLNADQTFNLAYEYLERDVKAFISTGSWAFEPDGNTIALTDTTESRPTKYKVGENKLTQLDMDGNVIKGPLEEHYLLLKQQ